MDLLISQGVGRTSLEKGGDLTTWCVCKEQTRKVCCESGEERAEYVRYGLCNANGSTSEGGTVGSTPVEPTCAQSGRKRFRISETEPGLEQS